MIKENYLEYPAAIKEAMGLQVDYAKLFPIYIAEQTGEGVISVTSDKQAYASGSPFYLTILLEEGYELEELSVVDNNDNEIELIKESETELPDGSVEIIMFGVMGMSAAFAKAACAKKKAIAGNIITLIGVMEDPAIYELSCVGDISVESIKNGAQVVETYSDLTDTQVSIQADADSTVVIKGDVTKYNAGQYQGWGYADGVMAKQLVFNNKVITSISGISGISSYGDTSVVTSIDVSGCTALTQLHCETCSGLTALDLSSNTALTQLSCHGCSGLTSISYPATNSSVSTAVAGAITSADAADGTVYTDSAADYYSTIADAANNKGWTIAALS